MNINPKLKLPKLSKASSAQEIVHTSNYNTHNLYLKYFIFNKTERKYNLWLMQFNVSAVDWFY